MSQKTQGRAPHSSARCLPRSEAERLSRSSPSRESSLADLPTEPALLPVDDLNQKGGLLGRRIEVMVVDPASGSPLFAESARIHRGRAGRRRCSAAGLQCHGELVRLVFEGATDIRPSSPSDPPSPLNDSLFRSRNHPQPSTGWARAGGASGATR
ncbi:MAG TPA: transporter substrate-binding protein [Geminicoccaceae bacterium]|nr:transporter substrate-binding protein [Geminicoccaceae bacterium]